MHRRGRAYTRVIILGTMSSRQSKTIWVSISLPAAHFRPAFPLSPQWDVDCIPNIRCIPKRPYQTCSGHNSKVVQGKKREGEVLQLCLPWKQTAQTSRQTSRQTFAQAVTHPLTFRMQQSDGHHINSQTSLQMLEAPPTPSTPT